MELKEIIPYYIGQKCLNTWFPEGNGMRDNEWVLKGYHNGYPKPYCLENDFEETWTDSIKLIMRKLEDMTEQEWKSIRDKISIPVVSAIEGPYIMWKDKPKHVQVLENRLCTNTLTFNDGIILLQLGFDLFGLCDSNQAIDATTLNQQNQEV